MPTRWTAKSPMSGYLVAIAATLTVLLLRLLLSPLLGGYDVAKQIRLEPWGHGPILIAITGWGQAEDKALSQEAGFDHHLVKPVDPDALLKFIQKRKTAHTESA